MNCGFLFVYNKGGTVSVTWVINQEITHEYNMILKYYLIKPSCLFDPVISLMYNQLSLLLRLMQIT